MIFLFFTREGEKNERGEENSKKPFVDSIRKFMYCTRVREKFILPYFPHQYFTSKKKEKKKGRKKKGVEAQRKNIKTREHFVSNERSLFTTRIVRKRARAFYADRACLKPPLSPPEPRYKTRSFIFPVFKNFGPFIIRPFRSLTN